MLSFLKNSLLVSQIRLRMGEYDFSSVQEPYPFIERGVNKKIVHPKYNFFTYEYDLALVRLEESIVFQPNVAPICLPASDETLIGENGTVTGWGRLSEGGTLPSILQQVCIYFGGKYWPSRVKNGISWMAFNLMLFVFRSLFLLSATRDARICSWKQEGMNTFLTFSCAPDLRTAAEILVR